MGERTDTARLRGRLPLAVDARLIEHAARSGCDRYRVIAAAGTDPARVVEVSYGPDAPTGPSTRLSPFARAIGIAFERWLYDKSGAALVGCYEETAGWRPGSVLDLRHLHEHGRQDEAEAQTTAVIEERIAAGTGPEMVLGARLSLQTAAGEAHVHPDLLVAPPGARAFRVGEIKSYLDLDGRTDPSEVASAARQAAVGVVAVRARFGEAAADSSVDLVFRVPRRPGAGVRTLDVSVEASTIAAFLAASGRLTEAALTTTGVAGLDTQASLEAIPHRWDAGCERHCSLSEVCHAEAVRHDRLELLGASAADALDGVSSLTRAAELAEGAQPLTPDEERVATALAAGWRAAAAAEDPDAA